MTNSTISVPVETNKFLALADFLKSSGADTDPTLAISQAIDYWMENATWKKEDLLNAPVKKQDMGYSWKEVFLPNGTSIRMKYQGELHYASVQGDQIIHQGKPVSPSEFTREVTHTSRNAWNDIWVKRPDDAAWISADYLRKSSGK